MQYRSLVKHTTMFDYEKNKEKLEANYKAIEALLEEGVTYYSFPMASTYGTSGGSVYVLDENGKEVYTDRAKEIDDKLDLFSVTTSIRPYTKVLYTIRKGEPIKVEVLTPKMLLEDIEHTVRHSYFYDNAVQLEVFVKLSYKDKLKMDVKQKAITTDGRVVESTRTALSDELQCLYVALEGQLQKFQLYYDKDTYKVETIPAIPGLTNEIPATKRKAVADTGNIDTVYALLESFDDEDIAQGIELLKANPKYYKSAEKRYLNFIRARLNQPTASLEQFAEAALSAAEVELLLGKHIAKGFISLSYFDDEESKLVVDVIGSLIKDAIDINDFITQAKAMSNETDLINLYSTFAKTAKAAATKYASVYSEGWFSKVHKHLLSLKPKKVMFEKTQYDKANRSLVLKEYMFFLNLNSADSVYFDIFQSDRPELTEMFWLLPEVPETSWFDVQERFPDSPLSFQRSALYRISDEGKWQSIKKP